MRTTMRRDGVTMLGRLPPSEVARLCAARAADIAAYFPWERTAQDISDLIGREAPQALKRWN
jgi:hypothetical protein